MFIGNHAVLFGEKLATETADVIAGLGRSGCDGIEAGLRFLTPDFRDELKGELDANHLQLSAYHVSTMATDVLDKPEKVKKIFEQAAKFLEVFPVKNIMYTQLPAENLDLTAEEWDPRLRDEASLKRMAEFLDELAMDLASKGITLHFHNHNWEFDDGGKWFLAIVNHAPHVHLGLDLGWTYMAGWDAVEVLERYQDRIRYVHLRDLNFKQVGTFKNFTDIQYNGFVDLGTGDVPFEKVVDMLMESTGNEGWLTIEYEMGEVSYERYEKATSVLTELIKSHEGRK